MRNLLDDDTQEAGLGSNTRSSRTTSTKLCLGIVVPFVNRHAGTHSKRRMAFNMRFPVDRMPRPVQ
jgi:hypothetical protein